MKYGNANNNQSVKIIIIIEYLKKKIRKLWWSFYILQIDIDAHIWSTGNPLYDNAIFSLFFKKTAQFASLFLTDRWTVDGADGNRHWRNSAVKLGPRIPFIPVTSAPKSFSSDWTRDVESFSGILSLLRTNFKQTRNLVHEQTHLRAVKSVIKAA